MKTTRSLNLIAAALAAVLAPTTVRAADTTPAETRAIAEEGFIYGLPIVMNYAVMYEYAVDRNSGQFKAPFNQLKNEPNVFTYKDTAIPTPNKTPSRRASPWRPAWPSGLNAASKYAFTQAVPRGWADRFRATRSMQPDWGVRSQQHQPMINPSAMPKPRDGPRYSPGRWHGPNRAG